MTVADTDQAAAGAEAAEPGGLGPRRSSPSPRQLLAYLPPLPEALRDLPRRARADLAGHAADYLTGVRSGVVVAACGWLVAAALTLALWSTAAPAGADPRIPLRVSGQLWLAAHHVLMHALDGPFGLSPLGFTLLPLLGLFVAGRRVARRNPAYVPRATLGAAAGYTVAACAIAASSADSGLHPQYSQVLFYPALIALAGHGAGAADAVRELIPSAAARLWPPHALRAALTALGVWIGAGAFTAACAVVVHADALAAASHEIGGGAVGRIGLFLVDLALVPNAVLWAGAVLTGPGFALGTHTSVTVFAVVRGPLPGLPLLAATPDAQHPSTWWLLLLVLPLLAGAAGTLVIARAVRPWSARAGSAAAMALLCGLAVGVLEMYAGGPVAFGTMSVVGATAWLVGLVAALECGLAATIVLGVWYALPASLPASVSAWRLWPGRGRDERSAVLEESLEDAAVSGREDDQGVGQLVGDGLVFVVPQRHQEPDAELEGVSQSPDEGTAEPDDLPVGLPDQPDPEGLLADALPRGALPVQLPEPDDERVEGADGHGDQPDGAIAPVDGAVGGDGDGLGGEEQQGVADPGGDQHERVDEGGADALTPGGEV